MQKKTTPSGAVSVFDIAALAVLMLVATTAFVVVAHPPVFVTHFLVAAHASPCQPQYRTNKDAQYCAMRKILRKVKLRQLV
jgi:hypothetical protein